MTNAGDPGARRRASQAKSRTASGLLLLIRLVTVTWTPSETLSGADRSTVSGGTAPAANAIPELLPSGAVAIAVT